MADGLLGHAWARNIHGTLGFNEIGQYLMLCQQFDGIALSNQANALIWKWNASGIYSASSAYAATFHGSI
jgi:hypothetical protein